MAATAEWLEKDYYRVLGVPETATEKEITRAYRRLARRLHPDTGGEAGDSARFAEVTAAYDVLRDAGQRREYDRVRAAARSGPAGARAGAGRWPHGTTVRVTRPGAGAGAGWEAVDLDDLLGSSFAGARGRRGPRPRRGADLEAELELSFGEAVRGTTRRLRVDDRTVTVRIPPGVDDGRLLRLAGRGAPGEAGGPAGDLLLRLRVAPHPVLSRQGDDLAVTVPVTFAEAALGADVAVPALGRPVTVRVPPGTRSGTTLRVRGHGVPTPAGAGDLLVTVEVDVPRHLTDEQRAAVRALAAAIPDPPRAHLGV